MSGDAARYAAATWHSNLLAEVDQGGSPEFSPFPAAIPIRWKRAVLTMLTYPEEERDRINNNNYRQCEAMPRRAPPPKPSRAKTSRVRGGTRANPSRASKSKGKHNQPPSKAMLLIWHGLAAEKTLEQVSKEHPSIGKARPRGQILAGVEITQAGSRKRQRKNREYMEVESEDDRPGPQQQPMDEDVDAPGEPENETSDFREQPPQSESTSPAAPSSSFKSSTGTPASTSQALIQASDGTRINLEEFERRLSIRVREDTVKHVVKTLTSSPQLVQGLLSTPAVQTAIAQTVVSQIQAAIRPNTEAIQALAAQTAQIQRTSEAQAATMAEMYAGLKKLTTFIRPMVAGEVGQGQGQVQSSSNTMQEGSRGEGTSSSVSQPSPNPSSLLQPVHQPGSGTPAPVPSPDLPKLSPLDDTTRSLPPPGMYCFSVCDLLSPHINPPGEQPSSTTEQSAGPVITEPSPGPVVQPEEPMDIEEGNYSYHR